MADNTYINIPVKGPYMDKSVPPNQTQLGVFSHLAGVDGRYNGSLRRFPGMNTTHSLDSLVVGMSAGAGTSFFKCVGFQKTGTDEFYRGFVVAWDEQSYGAAQDPEEINNLTVSLFYTLDNGTTWNEFTLWDSASDSSDKVAWVDEIDAVTDKNFLYVTVQGVGAKTVYYDTGTAALVSVDMGPGNFYQELPAPTLNTSSIDTTGTYFLKGDGLFQIAYRFYSSTRGVYSALSAPLTVQLDHKKTTYASGYVTVDTGGTDGEFVDQDTLTIGARTYEFDSNATSTGDVAIDISALSGDLEGQLQAAADAINGDSSAEVTAEAQSSVLNLTAKSRGAQGNTIALSISEAAPNTSDVSVSGANLTGGGSATEVVSDSCKIVIDFPNQGSPSWFDYTDSGSGFGDLFDKVEIFRSINLGSALDGAILYLESTIDIPVEGSWNTQTANIGSVIDEALPFYDYYNPQTDIVTQPPSGGAIGRYQGLTFMAQPIGDEGGLNTYHSSMTSSSGEYFSTYNEREGSIEEGRPLRYVTAGDSMVILAENSVTHVHRGGSEYPLEYTTHHLHRGLAGQKAAHAIGNSVLFISHSGLMMVNTNNMNMGQINSVSRLILDDWASDLSDISSGYDGYMDTSYFLNPRRAELLQINHTTQSVSLLEGCNYDQITSGPDVTGGGMTRVYVITRRGRILEIDWERTGYGNMIGEDPDTMLIEFTGQTEDDTTIQVSEDLRISSSANINPEMYGMKVYVASGDHYGEGFKISSANETLDQISTSDSMPTLPAGTKFIIAPVVFKLRAPALRSINRQTRLPEFNRIIMTSMACKFRGLSGYSDAITKDVLIGGYKDSGSSLHGSTAAFEIDQNPSEAIAAVRIDGIDVEPYLVHLSSRTDFELTGIDVGVTITGSRNVGD